MFVFPEFQCNDCKGTSPDLRMIRSVWESDLNDFKQYMDATNLSRAVTRPFKHKQIVKNRDFDVSVGNLNQPNNEQNSISGILNGILFS